jgi:hypothetical protein
VKSEEALHRFKKDRNILNTITKGRLNWIGHILPRNCLLKQDIEGNIKERSDKKTRKKT